MCKVLKNFTEGKQRNLGLILAIFTRFLREQFNTPTDQCFHFEGNFLLKGFFGKMKEIKRK